MSGRVVLTVYDYSEYTRNIDTGNHTEVWQKIAMLCGLDDYHDVPMWIDPVTGAVTTEAETWEAYQRGRRQAQCQRES